MERCIEQMRNGDYSPLEELYPGCFNGFVLWACDKYKCSIDLARDAFQGAIIATTDNVTSGVLVSLPYGPKPYVIKTARNMLIDMLDHDRMHVDYDEAQMTGTEPFLITDFEDKIDRAHLHALVQKSIMRLKPKEQIIFKQYYYEELDLDAIASIMRYNNVHSVRNKISSIEEKLVQIIRDSGEL
jgi:RNA polymerase sigma factor (sigma-70 family)